MNYWALMKKLRRYVLGSAAAVGVMVVTFEILSVIAIENQLIPAETPNYRVPGTRPFWVDANPHFGMWHPIDEQYVHTKSCFSALYESNSYGARDQQRSKESVAPRVLVIGDSFIEGYGLNAQQRTTNLLEVKTGREHLNFATSGHFGPTQYLLLYKHLAKQFRHDAVIVGILPDNDFLDDDPEFGKINLPNQYRPYFVENKEGYKLKYQNPDKMGASKKEKRREKRLFIRRVLQNFTYSVNSINYFTALFRHQNTYSVRAQESAKIYSGFRDFTESQLKRMEYVLGQLFAEVGPRPVVLVVIPRPKDLIALPDGTSPFVEKLAQIIKPFSNVSILDLHAELRRAGGWEKDYRTCDDHWSASGAARVAQYIYHHPAYQKFLNSN